MYINISWSWTSTTILIYVKKVITNLISFFFIILLADLTENVIPTISLFFPLVKFFMFLRQCLRNIVKSKKLWSYKTMLVYFIFFYIFRMIPSEIICSISQFYVCDMILLDCNYYSIIFYTYTKKNHFCKINVLCTYLIEIKSK